MTEFGVKFPDRSLPKAPELHKKQDIGIYNETDRLKSVTVWGPVGAEAVLAQLYPKDQSCFYEDMNVPGAREEAIKFADTLREKDVIVTSVRDTFAGMLTLPQQPLQKEAIVQSMIARAHDLKTKYPQVTQERGAERMFKSDFKEADSRLDGLTQEQREEIALQVPNLEREVDDTIRQLVEADIQRYKDLYGEEGEQRALALNKRLCLGETMPLGDAIYARDQMNVLLGKRVVSKMKYPIRQPEVALFESVYDKLLGSDSPKIEIPEGETFEGGDAYVHNGIVYVGVGYRTSLKAAEAIYEGLRPELEARGLQFAIVQDENPNDRPNNVRMDFMHLDTFSGPIGDKEIAVCEEEAQYRKVKYLRTHSATGATFIEDTGDNFLQHLQKREDKVVIIPREEQQEFGCNFLALDENILLLPLDSNKETIRKLREAGKTLIFLGLQESTRGYGASHCMTGQLLRAR